MDLLHTVTGDTCHVAAILGVSNDAVSKPALESPILAFLYDHCLFLFKFYLRKLIW